MKNNEYNSFDEFNKTNEYEKYEAVQKFMNNRETYSSNGESLKTEEFGYNQKPNKINSKKRDSGVIKKMLQKVTESSVSLTGGVAATVTAAVTTIVLFSSLYMHSPNIKLIDLNAGQDYVTYNLYIDEMHEDIDYYAIVSNNFETYKYELIEGENQNTIYNLMYNMKYNLSVLGVDEVNNEEVQYFTFTFYTTVESVKALWMVEGVEVQRDTIEYGEEPTYDGPTPTKASTAEYDYTFNSWTKTVDEITGDIIYNAVFDSIQHEYTATYNQLSASEISINYDNENYYIMNFNTEFDNSLDPRLSYRIILTNEDTNETYKYEGTATSADINVPIDVSLLTITYESIGTYNGVEKVFETITMSDALLISKISVDVSDALTLAAIDTYQFSLLINSDMADEEVYNSVTLLVTYDDLSMKKFVIEDVVVNDIMNVNVDVPAYCENLTIDYTIDLLGANGHNQRIINGNKEFTLETTYELVRVSADINDYKKASFEFMYHFIDQETTLAVKDVSSSTVTTLFEGSSISVSLNTNLSENEFTYYLSTNDGVAKETETSVIIPVLSVTSDCEFNYVNPGEAVVTFNKDDTMNVYLNTFFETEDPDVWYLVRYKDFKSNREYNVKYTESVAYIENIPYSNYGLEYFVYKTVGDIEYQLKYIIPSGGIELADECIGNVEVTENADNTVNVSIYMHDSNFDNVVLLSDGNEYVVSLTDIIFDENYYMYKIDYTLDEMPSELIVQYDLLFIGGPNYELVSSIRQLKGSLYKTFYFNVDIVN